ncbi:MAG: enoyl-CoA hydratase/isomerase family protein [Actinomycetia bacterium]|nr:enoyl-CoA hydratase/isomerase family protein [Actinomycetes bacterium]
MADYTELSYEVHGYVGIVTLRRPEARNALTRTTYAELEDAVRSTTARCLVITGEDPAFCSGDDVKQIMAGENQDGKLGERLAREPRITPACDALLHTDVPIVAAVNGAAVGWGMELALMADLRVASDKAKFGELFVLRGLNSDVPGLGRLAQLVGREKAAELLFTGEVIDAAEAARIGLVGRVVAHDELMAVATDLAHRVANNPPLAVQAMKRGLRQALDPDWAELGRFVSSSLGELFQTADHREGVAAFLEKRAPNYQGR